MCLERFGMERFESLEYDAVKPFGVSPRNSGQRFAVEALLAPAEEIPLVILKGAQGRQRHF